MKTNTDLFEKTPVPKAVATMAVPTMISMLVVVIYNGSFAGNAGLYDFYGIRPSVRYRRQLSDIESTGRTP